MDGSEMRMMHWPVQNSHNGEWMIYESGHSQQPFMVTLNHGNSPVMAKKQDWLVVRKVLCRWWAWAKSCNF